MHKYVSYVSQQAHNLTETGIKGLLEKSRLRNSVNNITGLLILFDGIFTQYIEGPEAAVDKLYRNIYEDSRHDRIIELTSGYTEKRYYGDWTMAYEKLLSSQVEQIIGYKEINKNNFFKSPSETFKHPGIDLLESFLGNIRSF